MQVIGVIDVNRNKEKGYETIVKDGFCDEVKDGTTDTALLSLIHKSFFILHM